MAVTVEGAIQEVLFARMSSLVLSPVHPVAWPNITFTPPTGNRYLEVLFVPNTTDRMLIDSDGPHLRTGLLQVTVRDALNQGVRILDLAGAVAAWFPADLRLPHALGLEVRITSDANISGMMVETAPPGVMLPVLIPYECWA